MGKEEIKKIELEIEKHRNKVDSLLQQLKDIKAKLACENDNAYHTIAQSLMGKYITDYKTFALEVVGFDLKSTYDSKEMHFLKLFGKGVRMFGDYIAYKGGNAFITITTPDANNLYFDVIGETTFISVCKRIFQTKLFETLTNRQ